MPITYVSIKPGKFITLAIRISLKSINGGSFILKKLSWTFLHPVSRAHGGCLMITHTCTLISFSKPISLLHRGHTPLNQIYLGATGFSEDQLHVEG